MFSVSREEEAIFYLFFFLFAFALFLGSYRHAWVEINVLSEGGGRRGTEK